MHRSSHKAINVLEFGFAKKRPTILHYRIAVCLRWKMAEMRTTHIQVHVAMQICENNTIYLLTYITQK